MIDDVRILIVLLFLCTMPLAATAQIFGQNQAPQGASAINPTQGAVGQPAITIVPPANASTFLQRQQRGERIGDPATDIRTQVPPQPAPLLPPPERIEFQDFVAQSTGQDLPIFGSELFKNVPSTFSPVENVPVTADYVIGPGDEILIRAWGQLDVDYATIVDRTGIITMPKVGAINVAGIRYQDLQAHLKSAIGRVFRNFDLTVSLGQLRAIQVFVVGQARRPGSYTVSSMSTLVNAVFSAGGPSGKGSMRSIQLKRGGKVVTELDL